jgi:hypothetical protein
MHVPLDAHIHYKCSFTVEEDSPKADWSFLIGAFAYWATEHYAVSEAEGDEISIKSNFLCKAGCLSGRLKSTIGGF